MRTAAGLLRQHNMVAVPYNHSDSAAWSLRPTTRRRCYSGPATSAAGPGQARVERQADIAGAATDHRADDLRHHVSGAGHRRVRPAHPDLELAIDYGDRVIDLVRSGYVVAIRVGTIRDSSLNARKLCVEKRTVCCGPGYAQARGLPRSIADLPAHACIDYAHVHTNQLWQFESDRPGGKPVSVTMRSRLVTNNGEAMRDAAIAGLGLAVLPLVLATVPPREGKLIEARSSEAFGWLRQRTLSDGACWLRSAVVRKRTARGSQHA